MIVAYPVFLLREPTVADIRNYIMVQSRKGYSYREKGATRLETVPESFAADHRRVKLGTGQQTWLRARRAITDWRMFSTDWTKICWPYKRIEPGIIVGILAMHYCFWSLTAARIVYVVDEESPLRRFGFAYGTVGNHPLGGEERFFVEWLEDDTVWYDLYAVSRSRHWVARSAHPFVRRIQKRFASDSLRAMVRAVQETGRARTTQTLPEATAGSD